MAAGLSRADAAAQARRELYGVSPRDLTSFVTGTFMVAVVVLLATLLPCRRAARVEAVEALRSD